MKYKAEKNSGGKIHHIKYGFFKNRIKNIKHPDKQ